MNLADLKIKDSTISLLDKYLTGKSFTYKQIFAITIPLAVDQAFIISMMFLNTAMISSAGVAAVSAVSMVDSFNIFLLSMFIAMATGGTVIVAQYKGSGNNDMVSKTATQSISVVTIFSVFLSILVIMFHTPILNLLFGKAEADVFQNATVYLIGSCISFPFIAIFQAITGVLRGIGQTKPCLNLSLFMNITNTILNVLFITIMDLSIIGLVISTITARVLGMVLALLYIIRRNKEIRFKIQNAIKLDFSILKKVMYIGIPFAAEQLFFNGGKLLTQTFVVQLGTLAITSFAIANSVAILFQIGPNALQHAVVTVVGQCIGQKNIQDARKFIKSFHILASILFVITSLVLIPFFPLMMKLFSPPEEIISTIFILVLMSAIMQPLFYSQSFIMSYALKAAGDSKFTSIAALLSMWLIRVVMGYVLGITLGFGIIGVWAAMVFEWVVRGAIFTSRFKGEKWYKHKLI